MTVHESPKRMPGPRRLRTPLVQGALLALTLTSCWSTQRWPKPMQSPRGALLPGDAYDYPRGEEEVVVLRHADPVHVRPAGAEASYPLSFFRKTLNMNAGSWVITSPGGRAEITWPEGRTIVLFGRGAGVVGSPKRGEPSFILKAVERARLNMGPEDQIELLGGAVLTADSSPITIERLREDLLRVQNESRGEAQVAFRDEVFDVGPGEVIDLPVLAGGSTPYVLDPGTRQESAGAFEVRVRGDAVRLPMEGGMRFRADGDDVLEARGARVRLAGPGEVRFLGLSDAPEPEPLPEPTEDPGPGGEEADSLSSTDEATEALDRPWRRGSRPPLTTTSPDGKTSDDKQR